LYKQTSFSTIRKLSNTESFSTAVTHVLARI
jgi:hypothetical protein